LSNLILTNFSFFIRSFFQRDNKRQQQQPTNQPTTTAWIVINVFIPFPFRCRVVARRRRVRWKNENLYFPTRQRIGDNNFFSVYEFVCLLCELLFMALFFAANPSEKKLLPCELLIH